MWRCGKWMVAVCRLFASLVTVATDRTLCVHRLELWDYCSIDNFRRRLPSTYGQIIVVSAVHRSVSYTDRQQVVAGNSQVSDRYNINVRIGRYSIYRYVITRSDNLFVSHKQI